MTVIKIPRREACTLIRHANRVVHRLRDLAEGRQGELEEKEVPWEELEIEFEKNKRWQMILRNDRYYIDVPNVYAYEVYEIFPTCSF